MDTSRIFVKGLPPHFTIEEFQRHFSNQCEITDAKIIPHRRIGYVGFKNSENAAKAIKYHNKSFIRMSRITVEPAQSVEDQAAAKPRINTNDKDASTYPTAFPAKTEDTGLGKRKRCSYEQHDDDTELQEYLDVMQAPLKSKIWANGDLMKPQSVSFSTRGSISLKSSDMEYDGDRAREETTTEKDSKAEVLKHMQLNEEIPQVSSNSDEIHDSLAADEVPHQLVSRLPSTSDEDWLRSRTSRLLGLVDADEETLPRKTCESLQNPERKLLDSCDLSNAETNNLVSTAAVTSGLEKSLETTSARLFVRNLSYTTSEEELKKHFETQGQTLVEEVYIPKDHHSGNSKGFAYVQYTSPEAARQALVKLDGNSFQGRLLHIIPATEKKHMGLDEVAISKLPLKKQQQIRRKIEAASSIFSWNSLYMNADSVISSISDRLGVSKSQLLDPTSSDAAVKQAHAETNVIQETKAYFKANGIDLDAFKGKEKDDNAILVKNFAYGTQAQELKALFEPYGNVLKILMPPSATMAIVQFEHAGHARAAFNNLAYRKFKDSVLFLEKAPKMLFSRENLQDSPDNVDFVTSLDRYPSSSQLLEIDASQIQGNTSTLFVRNLNFSTSTDRLREVFENLDGFASARVKMKPDPKKPGHYLSMGFGFVEFRSNAQAQAAIAAMFGYQLDGHQLTIRASHRAVDAAEERRKEDKAMKISGRKTKIIVKNLPFEASKKDVRALLGSYGQLRSVRVPKKFDNSTRGFAFADFVTAKEAENAMSALRHTHLLGRKLVLDFAAEDATDPEKEIERMQKKVGNQANKIALQRLAGAGRRKLNLERSEET